MHRRKLLEKNTALRFFLILGLIPASVGLAPAQRESAETQKDQAMELIGQGRYIDALPILEKIILSYPDDAELWAQFGLAIIVNASTVADTELRKEQHTRGVKALERAKQLGTENVRALDLLDQFKNNEGADNFIDENPEVEKALREGEAFFGRGDFDSAFESYEKAYKLNPKSYEATLFMGDSRYSQKRYAEAEIWFAKATVLDPNREMAFRFWGDALMHQRKFSEARDKFIEAMIASPYSRMTWETLRNWGENVGREFSPYDITPPGNALGGELKIDEKLLRADDGTDLWKIYKEAVGHKSSVSFAEETAVWRKLAGAMRLGLKEGRIKYPDSGLVNLVRIDDEGFIEPYILLMRPRENFGEAYEGYREKNREKLRLFIIKRFLNMEK
ncbi:MAG: tetratricopeptide repeat protein [Pyrinomonadaceae bacterium]